MNMIDFYSDKLVFNRLKKFYEYELPLFVKQCYSEFDEVYSNKYVPLSFIGEGSNKVNLFSYLESFVRNNYGVPFSIEKYFPFHSPLIFHESTIDFGFHIDREHNSCYQKYVYTKYDSIFNECTASVSSKIIKNKLNQDLELLIRFYKLDVKSRLKRFFIQGRVRWEFIIADQLKFYGIDNFPNCLNHEFKSLEYSIEFHETNGHLGSHSPDPDIKKKEKDIADKFYSRLKSKPNFTLSDVIDEKLFWTRMKSIYGDHYYEPLKYEDSIKVIDANLGQEKVPIINLKHSADIGTSPIELPIDFKLSFSDVFSNEEIIQEYLETFNEPENGIRKILGLPMVGEGWISETNLFYEIKNHFNKELVIHHGKPSWLGRQHLDIFMPRLNIAIEYQGDQHYKPIDFFGGKQGLKKNKERDEQKRKLCKVNNCTLIYVYPEYDIQEVLNQINEAV
jgi:hypothetical protein